nr:hypothetical protein [Saccharolobus solfataricus]
MLKNLRIRKFEPEEKYAYFTYSIKNDKREKSKELIKEYRTLLQKAIDYLWNLTKIQVRKNCNYR